MTFIEEYGKEIVSLLVPILTWFLNGVFKPKVKLQVALPHQFTFLVQQPLINNEGIQISPTQTVRTNSFIIRNAGRQSASKVELVFNWEPMCLNLWPVRHYEKHIEPDKRYVLIFDSLAPGEDIGVEVLSVNQELPNLVTIRSAECIAQDIRMYPQPVASKTVRIIATALVALGSATAVYLAIVLMQFLILKTPLGH